MIKIRATFSSPRGAVMHKRHENEQPFWSSCPESTRALRTPVALIKPTFLLPVRTSMCPGDADFPQEKMPLILTLTIPEVSRSSALTGDAALVPRTQSQLPWLGATAATYPLTPRSTVVGATQSLCRVTGPLCFRKAGRTINFQDLIH